MHKVEGRIASVDTPLTPCDGPVHENGQPTISFGVRGVLDIELRARSANRDLHSGHWGVSCPIPSGHSFICSPR